MNNKDTTLIMRKNYNSYHIPGQSNLHRVKRNAVFISRHNTIRHELSKFLGALMIYNYGDLKFSDKLINLIKEIEKEIKEFDLPDNPNEFLTEAVPNSNSKRRIDLVNLNTNDWFEFETKNINKGDCITIHL